MIKEFEIFIPDEKIELLNKKIDLTRWPDEINDERWTLGTKKSYLQEAVESQTERDERKQYRSHKGWTARQGSNRSL